MQAEDLNQSESDIIAIEIHESLDLSVHSRFVEVCERAARPGPMAIAVNLGRTRSVRDSGFAMLMMLRRCAGRLRERIWLVNCSPEIRCRLQAYRMEGQFHLG